MHFCLTSLAIFVVFLGIARVASHHGHRNSRESIQDTANEAGNDICMTPECYDTAWRIKSRMDPTVNPCDDFYEFTCGNFSKNEAIPEGTDLLSSEYNVKMKFYSQLKRHFEADFEDVDVRPFALVKTLYNSCMDKESIKTAGNLPLKQWLTHIGGWPILDGSSWKESDFDWMKLIADWNREGLRPSCFLKIDIQDDSVDSSRHVLTVNPPSWIIESRKLNEGFDGNEVIRAYYKMMVDVAANLGADRKRAEEELKEALLFQIQLNQLIIDAKHEVRRMTLKDLIERYPRVDWRDIFARMYSPAQAIGDDDVVVVRAPKFIDEVIELVSKTPKRVQANFAVFQMIPPRMRAMNEDIFNIFQAYQAAKNGFVETNPRWVECVEIVKNGMPLSVTNMYMKKIFKSETKATIEDTMEEIRREFRESMDKVSFLDNETRLTAKKIEKVIKNIVGHFPGLLLDINQLDNHYKDLELYNDYFSNSLRLMKFDYDGQVHEFRRPVNKANSIDILRRLLEVAAFIGKKSHTIVLTAGHIQGDFFHLERPRYMNMGTIGTMIAHELIHFFGMSGRHFDETGARRLWFTPSSQAAFDERIHCLVSQYDNYLEDTLKLRVDGLGTLEENIADNGGVKTAYRTYVKSMSGKAPEKKLPELDYSPNQMFWIAFGNMWCEKYRPTALEHTWGQRDHPIGRFRVTGSLSNSEEFANDFSCPPGSKMNPVKKCSVW